MNKLFTYIRLKDWWSFIIPPIISFYYLQLLTKDTKLLSFYNISFDFINFILLSIFVAAFGFFLNEWSDINDDKIAGKKNVLYNLSKKKIKFYFIFIVLVNILAILFIDWNPFTILLLTTQYLLFITYSVYPFRLKRNKYATLIIDALYSGTLFYILAFTIKSKIIEINFLQVTLIFIWGFIKGIRNIIHHLIQDEKHDKKLQIKTIATTTNYKNLLHFATYFLIPFEVLIFTFFLYTVPYNYFFLVSYLLFFLYVLNRKKHIIPFLLKRNQEIKTNKFTDINLYYEILLPLLSLFLLSVRDNRFIIIFLLGFIINKIIINIITNTTRI